MSIRTSFNPLGTLGAELPPGYTRLKAVQKLAGINTHIDTEIAFQMDMVWETRMETHADGSKFSFHGAYEPEQIVQIGERASSLVAYLNIARNGVNPTTGIHDFVVDGPRRAGFVDGQSTQGDITEDFTPTQFSLWLFGRNGAGAFANDAYGATVYFSRIYKDGRLIANLIPALDTNNTACLYDTARKRTFYSTGGVPLTPIHEQ